MQYEFFFWAMLVVVATSSVGGLILGRVSGIRAMLLGCGVLSGLIALALVVLVMKSGFADAAWLAGVASFLFSIVISSAFALLIRRVALRGSVSS